MHSLQLTQYVQELANFAFCSLVDSRLFVPSAIAVVSIALSLWQFTKQRDKAKYPDFFFKERSERDRKFLIRQARRRMQTAALIGIFGILMLVGLQMPYANYPRTWAVVWIAAIVFLCWGICLAFVDAISIRLHYAIDLDRTRAEKLALDYKMKKFQESALDDLDRAQKEEAAETVDHAQDAAAAQVPSQEKK